MKILIAPYEKTECDTCLCYYYYIGIVSDIETLRLAELNFRVTWCTISRTPGFHLFVYPHALISDFLNSQQSFIVNCSYIIQTYKLNKHRPPIQV